MVDIVKAREKAKKEKEKKTSEISDTKEFAPGISSETPQIIRESKEPKLSAEEPFSQKAPVLSPEPKTSPQAQPHTETSEISEAESAPTVAEDFAVSEPSVTQYLTFIVGNELYGTGIEKIDEIITWQPFTEVPNVPKVIAGIMPLRGRIVTIIDARIRLGHAPTPPSEATRIIVIREADELYGLWVDAVSQVAAIPAENIEDTATMVTAPPKEYLRGVYHRENDMIIILDIEKFLNIRV